MARERGKRLSGPSRSLSCEKGCGGGQFLLLAGPGVTALAVAQGIGTFVSSLEAKMHRMDVENLKTGDTVRSADGHPGIVARGVLPVALRPFVIRSLEDIQVRRSHTVEPCEITTLGQVGIGAVVRLRPERAPAGCKGLHLVVVYSDAEILVAVNVALIHPDHADRWTNL